MAKANNVFAELKFLGYLSDSKEVGTFPFYPESGQMNIGDTTKVAVAKVIATIESWFCEDRNSVLIYLSYEISAPVSSKTAAEEFVKRTGFEFKAGDIAATRTAQGIGSNAKAYQIAIGHFDLWCTDMRVQALKAEMMFEVAEGDVVSYDDETAIVESTALIVSSNGKRRAK